MEVVWFKRDLRVRDHAALTAAARRGPVVCLYIYEPALITQPDHAPHHLEFVNESLMALDSVLRTIGTRLVTRRGDATVVLERLWQEIRFDRIRAHQETGNGASYARDRAVRRWARERGVEFVEYRQNGVVRALTARDGWARQWQQFIDAPLIDAPRTVSDGTGQITSEGILEPEAFALPGSDLIERQNGGIGPAYEVLDSFLRERSSDYRTALSSPVTAGDRCSRLSPHLAYGNISIREVYQRAQRRRRQLQRSTEQKNWSKSLSAFIERLHWHCHFIQKLEDEPRIEFANMNRAFDGLREDDFDAGHFDAWCRGETGYPIVDACMRALLQTGWINFRMRAMLVSFSAYHLWLHWREPALHLARCFLDYEPGIHYSQVQMQAGTTGINALRIYSPKKQVLDHDPDGVFIRRWCPELAAVPKEFIAEPHTMPLDVQRRVGCMIGRDYPAPIVDHLSAYNRAKKRMYNARGKARASGDSARVLQRHGSRRGLRRRMPSRSVG